MSKNNSFTYTWKIENFSFNTCYRDESLVSPCFYAVPLLGTSWDLQLYPRGKKNSGCELPLSGDNFLSCFLRRRDLCSPENITVQFEFAIAGKDGSILLPWKSQFQTFKKGDLSSWGNNNVWNNNQLLHRKDTFFPDDDFTIQCCISLQQNTALYRCVANTVIECEKRSFRRSIENVSAFINPGHCVDIKFPFRHSFDMFVCAAEGENEFLSTCIRKVPNDKKSYLMSGKVSLLDSEGCPKVSIDGQFLFKESASEWKFPLINLKKIQKAKMLVDDTLLLAFELGLSDGQSTSETEASEEALLLKENAENIEHLEQLSKDFRRVLLKEEYSDFTLRCEGKAFPALRGILSARSPVFERIFQADFQEKKNGEVTVKNMNSSTTFKLLSYIYSGKANCENMDEVIALLHASEEYQVLSLKQKCANTIQENINLDNVCAILLISERFRLTEVKKQALKFILLHHTEVVDSENWIRLIRADVQLEIEVKRLIHAFQNSEQQKEKKKA